MSNEIVERKCDKCQIITTIDKFRKYTDSEKSFSKTCKKCLNEMDKLRKKNQRQKRLETFMVKCEKCGEEKMLKEFSKLKKFYKKKICISCYPSFLHLCTSKTPTLSADLTGKNNSYHALEKCEGVKEMKTEWCRNERKSNINYRLKKSIAARLRTVLVKNDSTMSYIGCNVQYLREWFEYNFTEEMNWDNYGLYWSIDHIIPVCKFDLTNDDEKLKCWNWSNLMPVKINYNSSKKNIDMNQINFILEKLEKFKEEGSTTKWFSEEFLLKLELAEMKAK